MLSKKGQVTLFVIIAILVVALVAGFFVFKDRLIKPKLSSGFDEIYNSFIFCVEEDLSSGIAILESQGGYIDLPEFETGSRLYPFSSQLDFLGNPIPYWYYVSASGFQRSQVPSKSDMENELETFVEQNVRNCFLGDYSSEGYELTFSEPRARVDIKDGSVSLDLDMDFSIERDGESSFVRNHDVEVNSNLGSLYADAIQIYDLEQEELFLETYAIDILRLYAPVDGVELSCAPKIWQAEEVFGDLKEATEINTLALKSSGKANDYYNLDLGLQNEVLFLNSRNWSSTYEVLPSDESFLVANPVGNQPGLGALGFCYVPYHFVYNVRYPVLVQVHTGDFEEVFQFPLAVVIEGNKEREALKGSAFGLEDSELCKYKDIPVDVRVYDENSAGIDASVSYECLGEVCSIGSADDGVLSGNFPKCVNGYVLARAEGYRDGKVLYSATEEGLVNVYLDRVYNLPLEVFVDGDSYDSDAGSAVVNFVSDDSGESVSVFYPDQKLVSLSEGSYEVSVQIYDNASLEIAATTKEQCIEVARGGIGSIIGLTKEECFDVDIPEQTISTALSGGGSSEVVFSSFDLRNADVVRVNVPSLPDVDSFEQLQMNYILIEGREAEVSLV